MKRRIVILTIALLGLASVDAAAQWYVFPGARKKKQPVRDSVSVVLEQAAPAPETQPQQEEEDLFLPDIPQTIRLRVMLPFESKGVTSSGMMDFYCGALLAAREAGLRGLDIDLEAVDCSYSRTKLPLFAAPAHITIGPVSRNDLSMALGNASEDEYIVSPLDQQAAALTDGNRIIQMPVSNERQLEDILDWVDEDMNYGDLLVIVKESGAHSTDFEDQVTEQLSRRGKTFRTISYGILQGLHIFPEFERNSAGAGHTTRYLIASENESFVGDAVRNIGMMLQKGHMVALYGTSKLRSFQSIEPDVLHELSFKASVSYHVDYESADVKSFVLAYRSLFKSEPGAFAFSGYDITLYCLEACHRFGCRWAEALDRNAASGLQTDFRFEGIDGGGFVNKAARRIVYNPDLTISVIK